jgi:CubicO group peptidase (beta-lactamase class C family)
MQAIRLSVLCAAAAALWAVAPPARAAADEPAPPVIKIPVDFVVNPNASADELDAQNQQLSDKGYRLISLSMFGDLSDLRYAAVWLKKWSYGSMSDVPAQRCVFGYTLRDWADAFDKMLHDGYYPALFTAVGSGKDMRCSGVFEPRKDKTTLMIETGMTADRMGASVGEWRDKGYLPTCATAYGDGADRRYAVVWEKNQAHVGWALLYDMDAAADQQAFDAETAVWAREAFGAITADDRYLGIYRDDEVGAGWTRGGMRGKEFMEEVEKARKQNLFPLYVQAAGTAGKPVYTVGFAERKAPVPRSWSQPTGKDVPELAPFDQAMKDFMTHNGVRGATLAVTYNGRLVLARGYTYAELDYPAVQPSTLFRIGSMTKPITSIAIHQLIEKGDLTLDAPVIPLLKGKGLKAAGPNADWENKITVEQLLSHLSGYENIAPDADVAAALHKKLPVSKYDRARYQLQQPMAHEPGTHQAYSNFGFSLLGMVVEAYEDQPYLDAVKKHVFKPLGLKRPRGIPTLLKDQPPETARQHDDELRAWPSVLDPKQPLVPIAYGGENYANFDSFGGWCMAAPDYAKILAAFDPGVANPLLKPETVKTMWTQPDALTRDPVKKDASDPNYVRGWDSASLGGGVMVYMHGGATPGALTMMWHRTDGISIVVFCNGVGTPDLFPVIDKIKTWPDHDLFPSVGIPPFPKAK